MLDQIKKLLGDERAARLANMPLVKERLGLDGHLQDACKEAAGPAHAIVIAIQRAGGVPQQSDVEAMRIESAEIKRKAAVAKAAAAEKPAKEEPAPAQADAKSDTAKPKKADK